MTGRVGLLGWPLEHSVSPAMHNAAFAALGLGWRYDLLPVRPEALGERVAAWLAAGYRGFNVTVPHKRAVLGLPQIAAVDPAVEAIGAANTLCCLPDGMLRAANTDWQGFAGDLRAHGLDVKGAACLLLGTGGSALAVAHALRQMGAASVTFVSRAPGEHVDTISYGELARAAGQAALIVNCTPVGMAPHADASPWPDGTPFPQGAALVDLIYNPPVTRLMAQSEAAGLRAIGGLGMLVLQGALSFEAWTGVVPPLAVMEQAARQALGMA